MCYPPAAPQRRSTWTWLCLGACAPTWTLKRLKAKHNFNQSSAQSHPMASDNNNNNITNITYKNQNNIHMVVPYTKVVSKSVKSICCKVGIKVHFRDGNNIKALLMAPKDNNNITQKSRVIYRYKCDRLECDEEYIRECTRTFVERFTEHCRAPSPIYNHTNISGHHSELNNISKIDRESHTTRTIKKTMVIRINYPSLNRSTGEFQLPHIWDEVLLNNPGLHLKKTILPWKQVHLTRPTLVSTLPFVVGMGSHTTTSWCPTPWHQ